MSVLSRIRLQEKYIQLSVYIDSVPTLRAQQAQQRRGGVEIVDQSSCLMYVGIVPDTAGRSDVDVLV